MAIANALNTSNYPCDGSNIYVSKLFGSDVTGTGSQFSPLATWTAAIVLANSLPGTSFQFYGLDGESYDETNLDFPNGSYIFAPNATFMSTTGNTLHITSFINLTCNLLQSTGGFSINVTAGYPILTFNACFAGDFNITTNVTTINANTIATNVTNSGGAKTVLNVAMPVAGADASCFAPWSLSLTPIS